MNAQTVLIKATELQKEGEYAAALDLLQRLAIENSSQILYQIRLADAQYKVGDLNSALSLYRRSALDLAAKGNLNQALALHKIIVNLAPSETTFLSSITLRYLKFALSKHSPITPNFIHLFDGLGFGEMTTVLRNGQSYSVKANQTLCENGAGFSGLVIVLRGQLLVSDHPPGGRLVEMDLLECGDFIGAIDAAKTDGPARGTYLSIRALSDCDLLYIDPHSLAHSRQRYPILDKALAGRTRFHQTQALLAQQEALGALPVQVRGALSQNIEEESHTRASIIFREGEKSEFLYLVLDGRVEVYTRNEDNHKLELALLGPGEFFGEAAALQRSPRSASVKARTDVRLGRIAASTMENILSEQPGVLDQMRGIFRNRVADTLHRLQST